MVRDEPHLRRLLRGALNGRTSVVLATCGEDGTPSTALNSWIVAKDDTIVALAMDTRSTAYANISAGRRRVGFEVLADDLILAVRGTVTIVKERLETVAFPCAMAHIAVDGIRDHTVPSVRFQGPRYTYANEKEHRSDIELAIFAELARDVAQQRD